MHTHRLILMIFALFLSAFLIGCGISKNNVSVIDDRGRIIELASGDMSESERILFGDYGDIYVDAILYGSFSAMDADELLATIRYKKIPTYQDVVRCVVVDAQTYSLVAANTYLANQIEIEVLPNNNKADNIIIFENCVSTGIRSQKVILSAVDGGIFHDCELNSLLNLKDNFYIDSEGVPHNESEAAYLIEDIDGYKLIVSIDDCCINSKKGISRIYKWDCEMAEFVLCD